MGQRILIVSGKGGTGKTTLTAGVATALACLGQHVLCVDLDVGRRNLDVSLGLCDQVVMDYTDVMEGRCSLERAATPHPKVDGLHMLTAPLTSPSPSTQRWEELLGMAEGSFGYIVLDAPSGMGEGWSTLLPLVDTVVVVVTPHPADVRVAQALVATQLSQVEEAYLVVNDLSRREMRRGHWTVDELMDGVGLPLLGLVPHDAHMPRAPRRGELPWFPTCKGAAPAFDAIARRLLGQRVPLGIR